MFATHLRKGRDIAPCDLGNRSMTASATESKRNTVGYDAAAAGGGGGEGEGEGAAEGAAAAAAAAADRRKGQEA